jgi:hypothetical protein
VRRNANGGVAIASRPSAQKNAMGRASRPAYPRCAFPSPDIQPVDPERIVSSAPPELPQDASGVAFCDTSSRATGHHGEFNPRIGRDSEA